MINEGNIRKPICSIFCSLEDTPLKAYEIQIRKDIKLDQRVYSSPSVDQVVVIWNEGNNPDVAHE